MEPVEVAERLYGYSLTYRSELTQSIQNPLLAVSVLAVASATLLPVYIKHAGPTIGPTVNVLFYLSSALVMICAALSIVVCLLALSVGKYLTLKTNDTYENKMTGYSRLRSQESKLEVAKELADTLTLGFMEAAKHNEAVNKQRSAFRKLSVILLYLSSTLFAANVLVFIAARWPL